MSDDDIRRIADAIEKMVDSNKPTNVNEIIAAVHENYGDHIKAIFDAGDNTFETMKMFRAMELMARQTAMQLRDQ